MSKAQTNKKRTSVKTTCPEGKKEQALKILTEDDMRICSGGAGRNANDSC